MALTLDQLETLDAVARTGSFAAAAKALHKVQSAVSYGVRELEATLGLPLFDRSGYRARLTEPGRAILDEARTLLGAARGLGGLAERLRTGYEPRLEIVIDGVLPMTPILEALRTLSREGVPTRVELRVEYLSGVRAAFERDDAHVMIAKDPFDEPGFARYALPPVDLLLLASARHPLARARRLSLEALREHVELVVHASAKPSPDDVPLFGGSRTFYLGDFHTKREALLLGLGFGWMPRPLVEADLRAGRLVHLRFRGSTRRLRPELVHRVSRPLGPAASRFRALVSPPTVSARRAR